MARHTTLPSSYNLGCVYPPMALLYKFEEHHQAGKASDEGSRLEPLWRMWKHLRGVAWKGFGTVKHNPGA